MSQRRFPYHSIIQVNTNTTENLFDWFQAYPINIQNQNQVQFSTSFSLQVLDFIKPFLQNFYSGRIQKNETTNQQNTKSNFNEFLNNMILQKPQFLTEFIYQNTPNIQHTNISHNYLLLTLRDILSNFTTVLFTKLNYKKIFHSHYFLPP